MYSMMIVDDEDIIVQGIKDSINWQNYGVTVAVTANSGREALEKAVKNNIDIVISDIRMPDLSGLELIKELKTAIPDIIVIFISAYQEFDYAQEAIQYGVQSYITKPIKKQVLLDEVLKAIKQLEQKASEKELYEKYESLYKDNLPILKENYLKSIISGKIIKNKKSLLSDYDIKLRYYNLGIMVIKPSTGEDDNFEKRIQITRLRIIEIVKSMQMEYVDVEVFQNDNNEIVVIFSIDEYEYNEKVYYTLGERIRKEIRAYTYCEVIIGVGRLYSSIQDLSISYKEAILALLYREISNDNKVAYIDQVEVEEGKYGAPFEGIDSLMTILENKIYKGDNKGAAEIVGNMVENFSNNKTQFFFVQQIFCQLLSIATRIVIKSNIPIYDVFGDTINIYTDLFNLRTVKDMEVWLTNVFSVVCEKILNKRDEKYSSYILKALNYMNSHYKEDISLVEVAEHVKLNPSYFSKLFKEETGISFINSLKTLRINKAKELIKNTDMKIYEICEELGYQSMQYFNTLFKKTVGMTPNEYRHS